MRVVFSAAIVLVFATAAQAVPITYKATLSGASEVPAVNSAGTGSATIIYDAVTHMLSLNVSFANLTGLTTASHIHCCAVQPGNNAGVATTTPTFAGFPLNVTSGTYINTLDMSLASSWNPAFVSASGGIAAAEALFANGLANNMTYLNIHTIFAPGGEIRGTVVAAPEPTTMALLGLGLVGVASRRLRRR
jgi:hypothetical protein